MTSRPKPTEEGADTPAHLTYEQAFAELEGIIATLESNDRPLEETLALYERGQKLARHCASLLDQAELRVQQLSGEQLEDFAQQ